MTIRGLHRATAPAPPAPKSWKRWLVHALLICILSALSVWGVPWITHSSLFSVVEITIDGVYYGDDVAMLLASDLSQGQSLFEVGVEDVEARLIEQPWVESVKVTRKWPDGVAIKISERRPVASVTVGRQLWAVDRYGKVLPPWRPGRMPDVPRLLGAWSHLSVSRADSLCKSGGYLDRASINRGVGWLRTLDSLEPTVLQRVSEIDVQDSTRTLLTLTASGARLILSPTAEAGQAVAAVAVLKELSDLLVMGQVVTVDYENQIVVTIR